MSNFNAALAKIENNENLLANEARSAFDDIFTGDVPHFLISNFLLALVKKGETAEELLGAVTSMRAKAITIKAPIGTIDIVGTGGDNNNTLNVSSATAFVVAACGVPVAKHGNRAVTSRSGSSDVLAALGINLEPDLETLEICLHKTNLCFLFAPRHHPAMRHVAAVRKELGVRTIFNLLGPLTNPANVKLHLIGAYETEWLGPMAEVLQRLGSEAAWIVHGSDDMDEITTTGSTDVVQMSTQGMKHFTLSPKTYGIPLAHLSALHGGDAQSNATEIKRLFRGLRSAYRDIVIMNAAGALIVAGKARDMNDGIRMAEQALDKGKAYDVLDHLVDITNKSLT
jgi:anthranilate phosphoribosyltransferase